MNIKTKKRIAREVIIFFSSLLFLAIIFLLLSGWSKYKKNQIIEYSKKRDILDTKIKALENNTVYRYIPFENYTVKQLHKLYQEEKIISNKISLSDFENSNNIQKKKLYDLGVKKHYFKTIDYNSFLNAWNNPFTEMNFSDKFKKKDTIIDKKYFSDQLDDYMLLLISKGYSDNQIIELSKKFKQERIIENSEINNLLKEKKSFENQIKIKRKSKFDTTEIIIKLSIFLLITIYPLRLFYFLILWSLKTLKNE